MRVKDLLESNPRPLAIASVILAVAVIAGLAVAVNFDLAALLRFDRSTPKGFAEEFLDRLALGVVSMVTAPLSVLGLIMAMVSLRSPQIPKKKNILAWAALVLNALIILEAIRLLISL